jgi:3-oxoacyl-[acyl-carrier protein] reductase
MITVKGKTALVTGSSRGIGRGIVLKLAECGANRIGVHYLKNKIAAEETAAQVRKRGADVLLLQADVSRVDEIMRLFSTVKEYRSTHLIAVEALTPTRRPASRHFIPSRATASIT